MSFEKTLAEAIENAFGSGVSIKERRTVHGGDANDSYALFLSNGEKAFMKANSLENSDFFRAEAEGLEALKQTNSLRVPEIFSTGYEREYSFLLMEYIESERIKPDFWENLGSGLSAMHKSDTSSFVPEGKYGFKSDNYIGAGVQVNPCMDNWVEFFAECRLFPQFKKAERYFDDSFVKQSLKLMDNLDKYLIEPERPSLLHGDLWAGNFMSDENGNPMLIDPAAYVGCNEADIAMTELFGGFDKRFYDSYFESFGKIEGYNDRRDLYNLYHMLNHLNLFGSSYLPAVVRSVRRYI